MSDLPRVEDLEERIRADERARLAALSTEEELDLVLEAIDRSWESGRYAATHSTLGDKHYLKMEQEAERAKQAVLACLAAKSSGEQAARAVEGLSDADFNRAFGQPPEYVALYWASPLWANVRAALAALLRANAK